MTNSSWPSTEIQVDGGKIKESDAMGREKFWEDIGRPDGGNKNKEHPQSLEENLPMVNYIMLHRIYDLLILISNKTVGSEDTAKMVEYHNQGYLLGPSPSYTPEDEVKENTIQESLDLDLG